MSCCRNVPSSPVQQPPTRTVSVTMSAANAAYIQSLKVGDFTLKNRIVFSPCTRNRGNVPGDMQAKYYAARAGAGLIITEGTLPVVQGYELSNAPGIYNKKQVAGWRKVTDAVHAAGGVIFNQIMNIGRVANPRYQGGQAPVAPSAIKANRTPFKPDPRPWVSTSGEVIELTGELVVPDAIEDFDEVLDQYRRAFENAKAAGFDGVEIHGANGYLLHQFLDSSSNVRTDKYGGSVENRARFPLEVIDLAISIFGGAGRVAVKISPEGGYNDMGMSREETEATFGHLLKQLEQRKIAFVELQRWFPSFDPAKRGTIIPAGLWRKYYSGILFVGGNVSIDEGLKHLASGLSDAVPFGRFFISNPDLVQRITDGHPLNSVDFTNIYVPGEKGYSDYKTWEEQSEEERKAVVAGYAGAQQHVAGERAKAADLYEQQEIAAGRTIDPNLTI